MINLDERTIEILHKRDEVSALGHKFDDQTVYDIKQLIRDVLAEVKPTPTDYEDWHYYNVAITHMESKIKELGL